MKTIQVVGETISLEGTFLVDVDASQTDAIQRTLSAALTPRLESRARELAAKRERPYVAMEDPDVTFDAYDFPHKTEVVWVATAVVLMKKDYIHRP